MPAQGSAAPTWTRRLLRGPRWMGQLALLDSWTPAGHPLSSPRPAWKDVLVEWTHSGDLTRAQAGTLLALDETTRWQA
jgi:hypothetical protein